MNFILTPERPSLVGASVRRVNDPRLLTGAGKFVDDISLPGMLHAHILRSPVPHGKLDGFGVRQSTAHLVIGPDEIGASTEPLPFVWIAPGQKHLSLSLGDRTLRYVGQPIGIVISASRAAAEDASECVDLDISMLPAVSDSLDAMAMDAPCLYPDLKTNLAVEFSIGDDPQLLDAEFASAPLVISRRLRIPRIVPSPMETRGIVADWSAGMGSLTVWISTQTPHHVRDQLAHCLRLKADQVRVIAGDVGGGFGTKEHLYPDEIMVCLASMRLGVPVKWIEDRNEHFTSTCQARDAIHEARLAMSADGTFLAIQTVVTGNLGAHFSNVGTGPFRVSGLMLPGPYRVKNAGATIKAVYSNTTPTGAYRGFGMQEAAWVRERLVDEAARELGVDAIDLRSRNMLGPEDLPHLTPTFQNYDSGDYRRGLEMVRARILEHELPHNSNSRIRHGVGVATHVEFTGLGPSSIQEIVGFRLGGYETAIVRMEPDGSVYVSSGVMGMGQGIETTLAQLAADCLGVEMDRVTVHLGDTATAPYSAAGSIASRSMTVGGGAVLTAAGNLREKILRIAAHRLEVRAQDLVISNGRVCVRGDQSFSLSIEDVASHSWLGWKLPPGETPDLEEKFVHEPSNISYPYATHAALVAVDLDTGQVRVERYWLAHDSGVVVNPQIVDGQIAGGVAQGLGIALFEKMLYDEEGQPKSTTFLDYLLPLSSDVPDLILDHYETPAPHIPGGMKGVGEGGTIVAPAAIGNAVAAAVPEIAEKIMETPISPGRLWELIHDAGLHDE